MSCSGSIEDTSGLMKDAADSLQAGWLLTFVNIPQLSILSMQFCSAVFSEKHNFEMIHRMNLIFCLRILKWLNQEECPTKFASCCSGYRWCHCYFFSSSASSSFLSFFLTMFTMFLFYFRSILRYTYYFSADRILRIFFLLCWFVNVIICGPSAPDTANFTDIVCDIKRSKVIATDKVRRVSEGSKNTCLLWHDLSVSCLPRG